jgi:hypothetical protein
MITPVSSTHGISATSNLFCLLRYSRENISSSQPESWRDADASFSPSFIEMNFDIANVDAKN